MPAVDWSRVNAGTFHDFHNGWIIHIKEALNGGLLPGDYYAQSEQRARGVVPDVLALHSGGEDWAGGTYRDYGDEDGGVAVAVAPPRVSTTLHAAPSYAELRRTISIRQANGDEIVAFIEIVSPANKDRPSAVQAFAEKAYDALQSGIHLLMVDLIPPGRHDPGGMHEAIWSQFPEADDFRNPPDKPLTLAAYVGGGEPTAYVEPVGLGQELPPMPLFLRPGRYVEVPLEATHAQAFAGVPERWRRVIEGR